MNFKAYALKDSDGNYLIFQQIGNEMIEVFGDTDVDNANTWDNLTDAFNQAKDMIQGTGYWHFYYIDCGKPVTIIEITKIITHENRLDLKPYY
jgi:hypothetical protein